MACFFDYSRCKHDHRGLICDFASLSSQGVASSLAVWCCCLLSDDSRRKNYHIGFNSNIVSLSSQKVDSRCTPLFFYVLEYWVVGRQDKEMKHDSDSRYKVDYFGLICVLCSFLPRKLLLAASPIFVGLNIESGREEKEMKQLQL